MENGTCCNFGVPEEVLQSFRRLCRDRHKRKRKMDSPKPTKIIGVKINKKLEPLKTPWAYYKASIQTQPSTGYLYIMICRVQEDPSLPAKSELKKSEQSFDMIPVTWELSVRHIQGENGVTVSGGRHELEMECENAIHAAALAFEIQTAIDGDPDNPNRTTSPPPIVDISSAASSLSSGSPRSVSSGGQDLVAGLGGNGQVAGLGGNGQLAQLGGDGQRAELGGDGQGAYNVI